MDTRSPRTALVDESFRRGVDGRGYSLLAAAIVPDVASATIERQLRDFVQPGQRRFHWRDERPEYREGFMALVAGLAPLEVFALAYCQVTANQKKAQHARVRSTWALVDDLRQRDVGTLVFESRQERNDVQDRREIILAQKAGVASASLVYRHGRPKEEPLLWLPDAVAGAVGDDIARHDPRYVEMLPDAMCLVRWLPGSL